MPDLKQQYADSLKIVMDKYNNLADDFFGKNSVFSDEMKKLLKDDFAFRMTDLLINHDAFCKEKFDRDLKNQ